jgi:hypothetical protein
VIDKSKPAVVSQGGNDNLRSHLQEVCTMLLERKTNAHARMNQTKEERIRSDLEVMLYRMQNGKQPEMLSMLPASRQVVKFLIQPKILKLPKLGPFLSLIREVIEIAPGPAEKTKL